MEQNFRPGTGTEPTSTIEISISCKNLLDKDVFSRSDPMCVVYIQPWTSGQWEEYVRTEVVWDNLNPEFATKVKIDYRFEEEQPVRFMVYDIDKQSNRLEDHDFLGFAESTVARIVSAGYSGVELQLSQNMNVKYTAGNKPGTKSKGSICLVAEEMVELKEELSFQFVGRSMGSSFLGCCRSRIFFTVSKINEAGKYILVWKSDPCPGPEPNWGVVTLSIGTVCNGDKDRKLRIEFFQEGFQGYHTSIGSVYASVNRLTSSAGVGSESLPVQGQDGKPTRSRLTVIQCKLNPIYTFLDYIRGGTQIHCCFAIDMTGSNGDPNDPGSLHYLGASALNPAGNPYEQAIVSVGEIIQEYDNTKTFPAYGFGARIPPSGIVSHKFHLNLQNPSPFCYGIPGVLESYRSCIRQVQLWGPTNFAPIIRDVATMALQNSHGPHYYVLLMITDGIISDMEETTEAIVNASTLPLSIIIVGVGGANFDAMDILDGDTVRLSYNGRVAARDIVQFVPYRDAYQWVSTVAPAMAGKYSAGYEQANTNRIAKIKLAKEVLAEVPGQVTSYMKSRGIVPMMPSM